MKCNYPVKKSIIFDIPGFPDPCFPLSYSRQSAFYPIGGISPEGLDMTGEPRNSPATVWNETGSARPLKSDGGYA